MTKKKNSKRKTVCIFLCFCTVLLTGAVVSGNIIFDKLQQLPVYGSDETVVEYNDWRLILVNRTHKIPDGFNEELTLLDCGKYVDSRIYPDLQRMFDSMRDEGIYPFVNEGYRTREEQEQMLEDKVNAYIYDGVSEKLARKLAEKSVAAAGTSEHELGIAVDIIADKTKSDNEDVYRWLAENAYKYGFILRYPQDKTELTGFEYEPWHYRYVGIDAAAEIFERGICLEEYLE